MMCPVAVAYRHVVADRAGPDALVSENGRLVDTPTTFNGRLAGAVGQVWLIVHPKGLNEYFVQSPCTANSNGLFERCAASIGRPDNDHGVVFEVEAVYEPIERLVAGTDLPSWPNAARKTPLIEVERR